MLKVLRVKDFAIADEINLEFPDGFTVFTGETGAGKSILVDAIGLLIGGRATADVVRDGSDEAVIEAVFDKIDNDDLPAKMNRYGIELDSNEILIRRNINKNGKNRIYINGILSTLSMLEDIGSGLVDIHGQHEHQNLLKKEMHMEYLDAFGRLTILKNRVREQYQHLTELKTHLNKLEDEQREKNNKEELLKFQLAEIMGAGLKANEERELASERDILSNSKRFSALSDEAYSLLYESEKSVLSELSKIEENIAGISSIDKTMLEATEMVRSSRVILREASEVIRRFRDDIRYDPDRLDKIEERLYLIERLKKKYSWPVEDIIVYQSKIEKELEESENTDQDIKLTKEEIERVSKEIEADAGELSGLRKAASLEFEQEVVDELSLLQMGNTRFVVRIDRE